MISVLLLRVSIVLGLVGISAGIVMGIQQDFTLAPAHAHLNLLGFVTLFLSGLYYQTTPGAAQSLLAKIQAWIAIVGGIVFPAGIATERLGIFGGSHLLVSAGSIIVLLGMVLFAVVVFRFSKPHPA